MPPRPSRKKVREWIDCANRNIDRTLAYIKRLDEAFDYQGYAEHSEYFRNVARILIAVQDSLERFKESI